MNVIKLEPGREPELAQENLAELDVRIRVTSLDPAGLFWAVVRSEAQEWQSEPCCIIREYGRMLYGTVLVARMESNTLASVHAEDLGRVAGLLRPVDAFLEVCGL